MDCDSLSGSVTPFFAILKVISCQDQFEEADTIAETRKFSVCTHVYVALLSVLVNLCTRDQLVVVQSAFVNTFEITGVIVVLFVT